MSEQVRECVERTRESARGLLTSQFERTLDPKKRLTIPSAWRHALGDDYVYVLKTPNAPSLKLVPRELMEARVRALEDSGLPSAVLKRQLALIGSNSELLEFDSQGRVRISDRLLAHANLKTGVVMQGAIRVAHLWAPENAPSIETPTEVNELVDALEALDL